MYLLLPKHYIQTLLFVCLIIAPKLLFGQYILDKQVKFEEKRGTKPILKPIEAFYAKGDKLYFMAYNSVTITDNNGLLVDKIPKVKDLSLGNIFTIGKVAVDTENNFYLPESFEPTIRKYSQNRALLNTIDVSAYVDPYDAVSTIETDNDNNIYFSSRAGDFVTVLNKDGIWLKQIGKLGTQDGEFQDQINAIVVSKSGTIYVKSGYGNERDKIQVFNKEGVFLRKIITKQAIGEFCVDNNDNVYILKNSDTNIYAFDNTGKALNNLVVSSNKNIYPKYIVKKSDGNIITYCYNAETTGYEFYDVETKAKSNIVITASDADYPTRVLDAQINPVTQNITFLDEYKVVTYDKDFNVVKSAKNFDNGLVTKKRPSLFAFDSMGKSFFLKKIGTGVYDYEVYSESNADVALCKIQADYSIKKIMIEKDSLNNPVILVVTANSISSFSFTGVLKKKHIVTTNKISAFNKNSDGTYSLFSTYLRVLEKYDSNFKLISSQSYSSFYSDDFIETPDGYFHSIRGYSDGLEMKAFNSKGEAINETTFDVNYQTVSFIRAFNNQLIMAGGYTDFFSVVNFKYDKTLQANYINGGDKISLTTLDKTLDLSTTYSSTAKNLSYKLVSGGSVKISSAGTLEVLKGGESVIEITSPATNKYNATWKKVLVTVNKISPTVTGVENIQKTTADSDFVLNIESNAPDKPIILLESGSSISFDSKTNTVKILQTGLSKLKVFAPETDFYKAYSYTISVNVMLPPKLAPQLTTTTSIVKKIDAADFNLTVSTKSDGKVLFYLMEGDAVAVSLEGKVKIVKAGIAYVHINQLETDKYEYTNVIVTITVEKLEQAIDAGTVPTSVYLNSTGFDINPTSNSGLGVSTKIVSGPAKLEGKRVVLLGNAGVIEMEFSQAGDAKYKAATTLKKSVEVKLVLANLEEPSDASVKVFPNPVTTTLQLRSDGKPFGLQIVSMLGTVVLEKEVTKEEMEIDLSSIKSGSYIMIVRKKEQVQYIKIQKL